MGAQTCEPYTHTRNQAGLKISKSITVPMSPLFIIWIGQHHSKAHTMWLILSFLPGLGLLCATGSEGKGTVLVQGLPPLVWLPSRPCAHHLWEHLFRPEAKSLQLLKNSQHL